MGVYALGSLNHSLQTLVRQYIFASIPFGRRCLTVAIFDMTEGGHDEQAHKIENFEKNYKFSPPFSYHVRQLFCH